jgi:hypothetical protein
MRKAAKDSFWAARSSSMGGARVPKAGSAVISSTRLGGAGGLFVRLAALEVEGGDLEAVEEEPGALWIDFVDSDALEDCPDGLLDCGAVLWEGDVEGALSALAGATTLEILHGAAHRVMVIAEGFRAKARATAAVSVGEDVSALEAFRCFCDIEAYLV